MSSKHPGDSPATDENRDSRADTDRLFTAQQHAFRQHPFPLARERLSHLDTLRRALLSHEEPLASAISRDFGNRSHEETRLAELLPSLKGIQHARRHLKRWMKPERRAVSVLFQPAKNRVYYQPKGVVGIIVPWNYPLYLAIGPLVGALAAGNRVMIKLSEFTPETSRVTADMLASVFSEDHVAVVTGDATVAANFSAQPFDHLFFTGSTTTGRLVMKAAAENLTPVTLELGGKSPAIVSDTVPLAQAAERIVFGKGLNAGQTCVAPDYVLCPSGRVDELVDELSQAFHRLYPTLQDNPDYTSIITDAHAERLRTLLETARERGERVVDINPGKQVPRPGSRKLPLSLIVTPSLESAIMKEELFGPILPVIPVGGLDEVIRFINERPCPLALYYFGHDRREQRRLLTTTRSGGVCFNDTLMQVAQDDLPFGGIGGSGMGNYHGHEGFLTFSHARGVFARRSFNPGRWIYPPYGKWIHKLVYRLFLR